MRVCPHRFAPSHSRAGKALTHLGVIALTREGTKHAGIATIAIAIAVGGLHSRSQV